jgi:predicted DsbA family dithiol-disulfide isomerase
MKGDTRMNDNVPFLRVDVFSDIACPWCWVGERRLRAALAQRPDLDPVLRWRPFQLRPDLPTPSRPWTEFMNEKFGGAHAAQPVFDHLTRLGHDVGLDFRFDRMTAAPNTAEAHRLILRAGAAGREWAAADALFAAHFRDGLDVGNVATLREVGIAIGLSPADLDTHLDCDDGADEVRESQRIAGELGITGVPFYVLNGRLGISGAQHPDVIVRAIDEALRTESVHE